MNAKAKVDEIKRKLEEQRAAQRSANDDAKNEQLAKDLEALVALEAEHGDEAIMRLDLERFVPGWPAFVVMKAPTRAAYKRFQDTMAKATKGNGRPLDVHETFARSCWVYPAKEEHDAMLEVHPGVALSISVRAQQFVEAKEADEGKG